MPDPLARAFACAAVTPGLRSVLLFDCPGPDFRTRADAFAGLLRAATGRAVRPVYLGFADSDDRLWGDHLPDGPRLRWRPGSLGPDPTDPALRLVLLPDLARLPLPAARACVALVGAGVAHVERHGHSACWRPDLAWLAACPRAAVGQVSPHLLDRFALRLQAAAPAAGVGERVAALAGCLAAGPPAGAAWPEGLLAAALAAGPRWRAGVLAGLLASYYPPDAAPGMRRPVALARLAHALARLDGAPAVTADHVKEGAALLGLAASSAPAARPGNQEKSGDRPTPPDPPEDRDDEDTGERAADDNPTADGPVAAGVADLLPATPGVLAPPHPEDTAPVEREAGSLRFPPRTGRGRSVPRGPVVGVTRTLEWRDPAVTATLREAAKFRAFRGGPTAPLTVRGTDWRRYRRAPVPETLFVLVLDHTALRDPNLDWEGVLIPHLHAAYVDRARVCVVQVGHGGSPSEFRAVAVAARNLLTPAVAAALDSRPGTATPLAHGLDLARQALHRGLRRGREHAAGATLVVLTDGRGNVPLEASLSGQAPTGKVGRAGVEDALRIAREVAGLGPRVRSVVLRPRPGLADELARALGAAVEEVPAAGEGER